MVWRNGNWVGQKSETADPAMRGVEEGIFTQLVKNTYKVLLTRGLLGTYLYSVDPETQEYFKGLLTNRSESIDKNLQNIDAR